MNPEDKEILSGIVVDPDKWDSRQRTHFVNKYGPEKGNQIADRNLEDKVARWKPDVERRKAKFGVDYKTRAQLEIEEQAKREQEIQNMISARQAEEQRKQDEFKAAVAAEVARILQR